MSLVKYIPVDTGRLGAVVCLIAPEVKTDPGTGEIKTDRDGKRLWVVGVGLREPGTRKAAAVDVTTTVEPRGVTVGSTVRLVDLTASQWEMEGRSGVSWRAGEIVPDATRPPDDRSTIAPVVRAAKGGDA